DHADRARRPYHEAGCCRGARAIRAFSGLGAAGSADSCTAARTAWSATPACNSTADRAGNPGAHDTAAPPDRRAPERGAAECGDADDVQRDRHVGCDRAARTLA